MFNFIFGFVACAVIFLSTIYGLGYEIAKRVK